MNILTALQPTLTLDRGNTYIFDQSDNTNASRLVLRTLAEQVIPQIVTVAVLLANLTQQLQSMLRLMLSGSLVYSCSVHGNAMGNKST